MMTDKALADTLELMASEIAALKRQVGELQLRERALVTKSVKLVVSSNISITDSKWVTIDWNSEKWDDDNMHDNATNPSRITINSAGRYQLEVEVNFQSNTTGIRCVRISKNGTSIDVGRTNFAGFVDFPSIVLTTAFEACSVGDYFIVQVYQNSGGSLNVLSQFTKFSCTRVN